MSSFPCCLLLDLSLVSFVNGQLSQWRIVTALGKFRAVPHQQLLTRMKRFDGVEVNVQTILTGNQVLFLYSAGRVHVTHPVAPLLVQTI